MYKNMPKKVLAIAASIVLLCMGSGCDRVSEVLSDLRDDRPSEVEAEVDVFGNVQDLWIYENITAYRPGSDPVELGGAIVEELGEDSDRQVELIDGVTFYVFDKLNGRVLGPDDEVREKIGVVAGLIEYDGRKALSVLATPDARKSAAVGFADTVRLDLSFLGEERLAPGDAIITDQAFLQGLPANDAETVEEEAKFEGLELLKKRMAEERVAFLGEGSGEEVTVLLFTNEVGMAVEGSTEMSGPAKSRPMRDGMVDGLDGCGGGLRCVADFFKEFGKGAKESWDLAWDNRPRRPEPEPEPQPEPCYTRDCNRSTGEPHLATVDGSKFDVMAVGEFVMMRNDALEVQKRIRPYGNSRNISAGTAVAMHIGDQRVSFDREAATGERLKVNGEPLALEELRSQPRTIKGDVHLSAGGDSLQVRGDGHMVTLLRFDSRPFLDLYIQLDPDNPRGEGLAGKVSGIRDDDFTARDGEVYSGSWRDREFYDTFVDSWRISDEESLFDYPDGLGTEDYTDRSMPENILSIDDLDDSIRQWAKRICEAAGITDEDALRECIFDVGFTEDPRLATSAQTVNTVTKIQTGELIPSGAIAAGLVDPDRQNVESELVSEHLPSAPNRILWTFTQDSTKPDSHPESVEVSEIRNPNELRVFQVTSRFNYPVDPILRFSPPGRMNSPLEAFEGDAYLEFDITPTAGPVTLEQFYVSMARGASIGDARGLHLRYSGDDFTRVLWFDDVLTVRPEIERFSVPLRDVVISEKTTFRLYLNTPGSSRTIEVGDLAFDIRE